MIRVLVIALALFVSVTCARAIEGSQVERKDFEKTAPLDNDFLIGIHSCFNAADRCLGYVENRASSDKVKELAKKMKTDHDNLSRELGTTIKNKKLAIVAGLEKDVNERLTALSRLEKTEFDVAFLKETIAGHEKVIRMAEHQVAKGKDEDINKFAKDMLPTLRDHLKHAKELQAELK